MCAPKFLDSGPLNFPPPRPLPVTSQAGVWPEGGQEGARERGGTVLARLQFLRSAEHNFPFECIHAAAD